MTPDQRSKLIIHYTGFFAILFITFIFYVHYYLPECTRIHPIWYCVLQ